jgi:predicted deacetylase
MLCVSIHDVAPATWSDCLRLVEAVRAVADIPLTWLVVPHYHFRPEQSPAMEACLNVALERGDELALHGYSHLDTEAGGGGLRARFLRNVYTRREGEFAALAEAEARQRLELGLDWFAARGWTPTGFIPPAWLLGEGAWRALRDAPFAYTTTFSHFHCLPGGPQRRAGRNGEAPRARPAHDRGQASGHAADGQPIRTGVAGSHGAGSHGYRGGDGASVQSVQRGHGNGGSSGNGYDNGNGNSNSGHHGIGNAQGVGNPQHGRGNHSGQDSLNSQFDRSNWAGPLGPDSRQGVHSSPGIVAPNGQRDDAALGTMHDAHDLQRNPHTPFVPNNRHGTHAILSPSLVYAARNRSGRFLSPRVADATAAMLARAPLVRFSLHPPDARYPELVRHIQQVLERLLAQREAVTKAEYARRLTDQLGKSLTSKAPTSRPASSPDRSNPQAVHHAAGRTSC